VLLGVLRGDGVAEVAAVGVGATADAEAEVETAPALEAGAVGDGAIGSGPVLQPMQTSPTNAAVAVRRRVGRFAFPLVVMALEPIQTAQPGLIFTARRFGR